MKSKKRNIKPGEAFSLNNDEVQSIWDFYHTDPVLQSCRKILHNYLYSRGFHITKGSNNKAINYPLRKFIERHWIPLCKDIQDHLKCFGFVPVKIIEEEKGNYIPIVPHIGTYEIQLYVNDQDMKIHYQFFFYDTKKGEMTLDKNVIFFHDNHPSLITGAYEASIRSVIKTLLEKQTFINQMYENAAKAENIRCDPKIFLRWIQENQIGGGQNNNTNTNQPVNLFNVNEELEQYEENMMTQNEIMKSFIEMLQSSVRKQNRAEDIIDNKTRKRKPGTIDTFWQESIVPVPPGMEITQQLLPQTRNDLMFMERELTKMKYNIMGIPSNIDMIFGPMNSTLFHGTLQSEKRKLSDILSHLYYLIYNEKDIKEYIQNHKKKEFFNISDEDDLEPDVIKKETEVRFDLPGIPTVTNNDLNDLYGRGIIEWDTYSDLMCRSCGIPSSKRNKKEPQTIITNMFGSNENEVVNNENLQTEEQVAQQKENEMDVIQQQVKNNIKNKSSLFSLKNKKNNVTNHMNEPKPLFVQENMSMEQKQYI